jgi:hypothetical protein
VPEGLGDVSTARSLFNSAVTYPISWRNAQATSDGPKLLGTTSSGHCILEIDGNTNDVREIEVFCAVGGASSANINTAVTYMEAAVTKYSGNGANTWLNDELITGAIETGSSLPDITAKHSTATTHDEFLTSSQLGGILVTISPLSWAPPHKIGHVPTKPDLTEAVKRYAGAAQDLAKSAERLPVQSPVAHSIIMRLLRGQAEIAGGIAELIGHLEENPGQIGH